jgi:hypothetical protein
MRKVFSTLDQDQRAALVEVVDFGIAIFSAGLIVAVLQGLVNVAVGI